MSAERDYRAAYRARVRLYARAAAFLLGALLVLAQRLPAQQRKADHDHLAVTDLAEFNGFTVCHDGRTFSFTLDTLSFAETNVVNVHEAKHREQAGRFGNDCTRFYAWYDSPVGKLDSEAEAYMADLCVAVAYGADPLEIRQNYARRIARYFGGGVNQLQIVEAMRKFDQCPIDSSFYLAPDTARTFVMPGWQ